MIMAIDPGQNVGMAFRFDNGNWGTLTVEKVPDEDDRLDMVLSTLVETWEKYHPTTVVIERFATMSRYVSKYGLETIELVGAVRAVAYVHKITLVQQMPNQRLFMQHQAKELLREAKRRHTDHEVSALAHLLAHEYKMQLLQDKTKPQEAQNA